MSTQSNLLFLRGVFVGLFVRFVLLFERLQG